MSDDRSIYDEAGSRPIHFNGEVSLGHILTTLAVVASVAGSFALMRAKDAELDRRVSRVEELAADNATRMTDFSVVLTRVDERTVSIADLVRRMESRQTQAEARELERLTREGRQQ